MPQVWLYDLLVKLRKHMLDTGRALANAKGASEWEMSQGGLWDFAVEKLWLDRGCLCADRGTMFKDLASFDGGLNNTARFTCAYGAVKVNAVILRFLREQDESGYTRELIEALWAKFPADCKAIGIGKPDETPSGGGQGGEAAMARNGIVGFGNRCLWNIVA